MEVGEGGGVEGAEEAGDQLEGVAVGELGEVRTDDKVAHEVVAQAAARAASEGLAPVPTD